MGKRRNLKENAKNFKRLIISHLVSFGFLWILGSIPVGATMKTLTPPEVKAFFFIILSV